MCNSRLMNVYDPCKIKVSEICIASFGFLYFVSPFFVYFVNVHMLQGRYTTGIIKMFKDILA